MSRCLVVVECSRADAALLAQHERFTVLFASPSATERRAVDANKPGAQAEKVRALLTYHQAAEALALSETQVRNLVRSGRLDTVSIGRSRRIPVVELERFVERLGAESAA